MKWTPKQITLPLLIAISLTSISVGVLYYIYKKDEEDASNTIRSRPKKNRIIEELEVPRQFVPVVIGRGGASVKSIENSTSTRIRFADDNVDLAHRVCYIQGETEGIRLAEAMIKNIIQNQPIIESYDLYVPNKFYYTLLAARCQIINGIQAITKAKIILDREYAIHHDEKKRIIIRGTAEQIASALSQIEDRLHDFNSTQEQLNIGQSSRPVRNKTLSNNISGNGTDTRIQTKDGENLLEGTMEVYVSAVESPSQFWVQAIGPGALALDDLVKSMTLYYGDKDNRALHNLENITIGQTVAAKFSFDNCWYRSEIIRMVENDKYEIYFLDYGDHEIMEKENILELRTDFLSLRFQAIEFSLANVSPIEDDWSVEACDRFEEMTSTAQWKVLVAKVRGYKERISSQGMSRRGGSPIPCADLFSKSDDNQDINIGKQLVIEKFAVAESGTWSGASSTISLSKQSNDNSKSPTSLTSNLTPKKSTPRPDIMTPKYRNSKTVEEIDLVTPKRTSRVVEEIDLVTPVKDNAKQLDDAEREQNMQENGNNDNQQHQYSTVGNQTNEIGEVKPKANAIPGGYENNHADFDGMEIF